MKTPPLEFKVVVKNTRGRKPRRTTKVTPVDQVSRAVDLMEALRDALSKKLPAPSTDTGEGGA